MTMPQLLHHLVAHEIRATSECADHLRALCDDLYTSPGPPAEIQRKIREAGAAPDWATR